MEDTETNDFEEPTHKAAACYSGLDPMEDTETSNFKLHNLRAVDGYSGLDPMEDTETLFVYQSALGC